MKNSKNPLVSIIIPVYNGSRFMEEAINSALNQTYKNIEVIVVNDGSNDNGKTEKIALSYGDKIKYLNKENGGVSTALNLAIKNMKGEYFSWLSHDDVYELDKIEKQINYLNENNLINKNVVLFSDYYLIDEKSNVIAESKKNTFLVNKKPLYGILRGDINGITLLIPKKAFDECGLFDESKRCTQDYEKWWEMMPKYKFVHMPIFTAKSRYHMSQESHTNPRVLSEGNPMWLRFMNELSDDVKIELNGSVYNFYKEMANFMKDTPYKEVYDYCIEKMKNIEKAFIFDDKIKVSIIIPFYHRVFVTKKAINSALNQTYKNIEIILVNDGSTDNVDEIKKIAKNNKIKYIDLKKNKGASFARNEGIKASTGDYIAFLDSDDEFLKDKIKIQLREMLLTNAVISHTSYYRVDNQKNKTEIKSGLQNGEIVDNLIYSCGIATPTVMLKSSYIKENNLFYDTNLIIGEDTCYWLSIIKNTWLLGIDKPLSVVHTNSLSAAYNKDKQIIGLKTILKFVLNDPDLSVYDREIAILANNYSMLFGFDSNDFYKESYLRLLNSKSMKLTKPFRIVVDFLRRLKAKLRK